MFNSAIFLTIVLALFSIVNLGLLGWLVWQHSRKQRTQDHLTGQFEALSRYTNQIYEQVNSQQQAQTTQYQQQSQALLEQLAQSREHLLTQLKSGQLQTMEHMHQALSQRMQDIRDQLQSTLRQNTIITNEQLQRLTEQTNQQLTAISGVVEQRLADGFAKTTQTFTDVVKRLALIDEAQKKITELSSHMISLQEILGDKRSRGAFGETQLSGLVHNVLPESHFALQHTLSNGKRVDCMLFLPEPTGNVAIDAKFPLESFRALCDAASSELPRLSQQFRKDIRKHINDIADKYILPPETADGAVMFLPAEAVFAEIHARYPELVEEAHRRRVWLVSPTTMMAILTTARTVLKDAATRKQVHLIQTHLIHLAKDFARFEKRMDKLAHHIQQAHSDVSEVHISAQKISNRFSKIEQVELKDEPDNANALMDSLTDQ
jgi:DNA recombination protein RmuC